MAEFRSGTSCVCLLFWLYLAPSNSDTDACSSQPMSGHAVLTCNKFPSSSTMTCPRKCLYYGIQRPTVLVLIRKSRNRENYIHRIGRSGRFGRKGVAINVRKV